MSLEWFCAAVAQAGRDVQRTQAVVAAHLVDLPGTAASDRSSWDVVAEAGAATVSASTTASSSDEVRARSFITVFIGRTADRD